eukprot:63904_1
MASLQPFVVLLHCICLVISQLNQYEMVNDSFWRSTSNFRPISSTQYGTIQLLHSLRMEFKLRFHSRNDYSTWQNIFRIGYKSRNNSCHGYGSRYPSLWFTPRHNNLNLGISQQGNCHYGPWKSYPIHNNQTYLITIQFNDTWIQMNVNHRSYINEQRPSQTLNDIYNQHLGVWISTDKTKPATENLNLTLSDITIKTWDTPSHAPTYRPTQTPSTQLDQSPSNATLFATPTSDVPSAGLYRNLTQFTEQNILFLMAGVLISSLVCLCVVGSILFWFCCYQLRRRESKYHLPRKLSKPKRLNCEKLDYDESRSEHSAYMSQTLPERRTTSLEAAFGTEIGHRNSSDSDEEEGVLEKTMLDVEGYGMLDEEVVAAVNQSERCVEKAEDEFVGMLNNANAVNDLMLNDVISEMATARNEEVSTSSDEDLNLNNGDVT